MKALAAAFMGFLSLAAESADSGAYDPHVGRHLVWSDEFDGSDLDVSKWNFRQTMTLPEAVYDNGPDTVRVEDGCLKMMVRRSGNAAKPWKLPQGVTTSEGMSFKYGYLEMRARLPFRNGAWPSFWTQTTEGLRKAAYMAEVDIFESLSTASISSTFHKWQGARHALGDGGGFTFSDASNLPGEYHVYGFEWNPKEMAFSVDGTVYWRRAIDNAHDFGTSTIAGMEGFHDYMFVILNNEIMTASTTDATPGRILPDDTPIPVEYWVDWIRLYQDPNSECLNAKTDDRKSVGHTPLEAWTTGANPGVGLQGGTWTASRRERANDPISAGALMTRFVQTDRKVGFSGGDSSQAEVFVVCGDGPYEEDGCVFSPGEIVLKPTSKGYGNWRVAVTYEVPRSGWYSMSARFRAADMFADGKVDTTVLVDGIVLQQEELSRTKDGEPAWGHACTFAHRFLPAGTRLEFVVGPQWDDYSEWWSLHANDATALALSIVEEKALDGESQILVADLGQAIGGLTPQTAGTTGTVSDPSGLGTWSLCHFARSASFADASARLPLSRAEANDFGGKGVAFRSASLEGANPQVKVNGGSRATALGVTEQEWVSPYDSVAPGEIVLNPSTGQCVGLRFVPGQTGGYVVSVVARDLAMSWDNEGAWGDSGVDVSVAVNGGVRFSSRVSVETQMALGCYQWLFGSTDALSVAGGTPIDIVIDPRSGAAYDYTGLSVRVVRVPSSVVGWDASTVLQDVARAGDATAVGTGDWSFGSATVAGKSGDFKKMAAGKSLSANYRGLTGGGATIAGKLTGGRHRAADEGLSGMGCGNGDPWIAEDEFVVIPGDRVYGVCRFTVPADGVYRVDGFCHDLNMGFNIVPAGVTCRLYANDRLVASGVARCDDWVKPVSVANLTAERLYLRKGDVIDLGVISLAKGGWNNETAVRLRISALGSAPEVVSLDISPASATVYAGRGLVGFESEMSVAWPSVGPIGGGRSAVSASNLRRPDGTRTQMGFTLSPPAGGEFAVLMAGEGLLSDGVVSVGSGMRYGWSLTGLVPDEDYTLYLYGVGAANFTAGGATVGLAGSWLGGTVPDFAVLRVRSDRDGVVSGEFSGLADAIGVFCGLQVEGPKTAEFHPGMAVIVQ